MTKRVHFASANVHYSDIPLTPSPTHSISTLSSLSNPSTPPPVNLTPMFHPRSPFEPKASPLPTTPPPEIQIHFLLAYIPYGAPPVHYDVSLPPAILDDQISAEVFAEPATQPALSRLTIICPHLQWQIDVSSWSQNDAIITVLDVFKSIYHGLRFPVHPTEYGGLLREEAREVDMAYFRRCGRFDSDKFRRAEEEKGIKRVDFLTEKSRFLGLSGTLKGEEIWELNLS